VRKLNPRGLILSGGWASVYESGAPKLPEWVHQADLPVLGVCYGMQLQSYALGGQVAPPAEREFGPATIEVLDDRSLFAGTPSEQLVWMSHGDRIEALPPGFLDNFDQYIKVINPEIGGNEARWLNHSCDPNCESIEEDDRIFIYAMRDIEPGEELFYDYAMVIDEPITKASKKEYECRCGSSNCRGTMLAL
jgi:hypothetical protein